MARASAASAAPAGRVAAPARPRPRSAPAPARRRSGPAQAPRTATRRPAARRSPVEVLTRLAEGRMLDRLLRGRLWVGCVAMLLAGIVFLNVSLLQLNQDIARTGTLSTALDRQNSGLRMRLASLDSSERIQRLAAAHGLVMPAPGQYRYLRSRPRTDGLLAARRTISPQPATTLASTQPAAAAPTVATAPATSTPAAPVAQVAPATPTTQTATSAPVTAPAAATPPGTTP